MATTQDPAPEPADRISPTFARKTVLGFHFDEATQKAGYNRPCLESRVMHAATTKAGSYHLWLMQRFDFLDSRPGAQEFFEKATLLPGNLGYDEAINVMANAMKGWRNEGFSSDSVAAAPPAP